MEFPEAFWEGSVDYFGAAVPGGTAARGRCFMFWNLQRFAQKPILTAVVAGAAAEVDIEPRFCTEQLLRTLAKTTFDNSSADSVIWDLWCFGSGSWCEPDFHREQMSCPCRHAGMRGAPF